MELLKVYFGLQVCVYLVGLFSPLSRHYPTNHVHYCIHPPDRPLAIVSAVPAPVCTYPCPTRALTTEKTEYDIPVAGSTFNIFGRSPL